MRGPSGGGPSGGGPSAEGASVGGFPASPAPAPTLPTVGEGVEGGMESPAGVNDAAGTVSEAVAVAQAADDPKPASEVVGFEGEAETFSTRTSGAGADANEQSRDREAGEVANEAKQRIAFNSVSGPGRVQSVYG